MNVSTSALPRKTRRARSRPRAMPKGRLIRVAVPATSRLRRTACHSAAVNQPSAMPHSLSSQRRESVLLEDLRRRRRLHEREEFAGSVLLLSGLEKHQRVADRIVGGGSEGVNDLNLVGDPGVRVVDDTSLRLASFYKGQRPSHVITRDKFLAFFQSAQQTELLERLPSIDAGGDGWSGQGNMLDRFAGQVVRLVDVGR